MFKRDGKISFITSQNIYVKFENTEGISVGDTVYYNYNGKFVPAIVVQFLSTTFLFREKNRKYKFESW